MKHGNKSDALDYICKLYAGEDKVLHDIRQTFEQRGMAIQVGAEEGKILHMLIKMHRPTTVVEIGTLGGYSAIWMARALPKNGHLHTIEHDAEHAELARKFIRQSDVRDKITVWEGKADTVLKRVAETAAQVDAVFIDADKISYPEYLDWAEAHVKPGGLIIADNTMLFGTVYQDALPEDTHVRPTTWEAMKRFNERLADSSHFDAIMLPTDEGLSIAMRKEKNIPELF